MAKGEFTERYRAIGRRIAFYRTKRGWTQDFFADKIGISKSYLSKIEAAQSYKSFSLEVLFLIAKGLDMEPSNLLFESEQKK